MTIKFGKRIGRVINKPIKITLVFVFSLMTFEYSAAQTGAKRINVANYIAAEGDTDKGILKAVESIGDTSAVVYFPAGTYRLRRSIIIKVRNKITIEGDGESTILDISTNNTYTRWSKSYVSGDTLLFLESTDGYREGDGITTGIPFQHGFIRKLYAELNAVQLNNQLDEDPFYPPVFSGVPATGAVPVLILYFDRYINDSVTVHNLRLRGSNTNYYQKLLQDGMQFSENQQLILAINSDYGFHPTEGCRKFLIENVKGEGSVSSGFLLNVSNVEIRNCTLIENLEMGIHISGWQQNWIIENNVLLANWVSGIYFCNGGDSVVIRNNFIRYGWRGIHGISGSSHDLVRSDSLVWIEGNTFTDFFDAGIAVGNEVTNIYVRNNLFEGNRYSDHQSAIILGDLEEFGRDVPGINTVVENNTINNWGKGIKIGYMKGSTITNNTITNCDTAISFQQWSSFSITANSVVQGRYPEKNFVTKNILHQNKIGLTTDRLRTIDSLNYVGQNSFGSNTVDKAFFNARPVQGWVDQQVWYEPSDAGRWQWNGASWSLYDRDPQFVTSFLADAQEDSQYVSFVYASDPDSSLYNDSVRLRLMRAPSWITIDSISGKLNGRPQSRDVGTSEVEIEAYDNLDGYSSESFRLSVLHTNHPPVFRSMPATMAIEDSLYSYRVRAEDTDSALFADTVRYRLTTNPTWLSLDTTTHSALIGRPTRESLDSVVVIVAYDGKGGQTEQKFNLQVNHRSIIVGLSTSAFQEDSTTLSQILTISSDSLKGDTLVYHLITKPTWLSIDTARGIIRGVPKSSNVGDTLIMVRVEGRKRGMAQQSFPLTVVHTNHVPMFVSIPDTIVIKDSLYVYQPHATDRDSALFGDTLGYRLIKAPSWITIDSATHRVTGRPGEINVGDTVVSIQVSDAKGGLAVQTFSLHILPASPKSIATVRIMLEGPFSSGAMLTTINNILPLASPYTRAPRVVDSIPGPSVVDWVNVELRRTAADSAVATKSFFLRSDGFIVDSTITYKNLEFNLPNGSYYIVVRHRNHLAIMSAQPVALTSAAPDSAYDFSVSQSRAYGVNPMKQLAVGVFGMIGGDGNADGGVDAIDRNTQWRPRNGTSGYVGADFNLDGGVDAIDLNKIWRKNNGLGTQLPRQ